MRFFATVVLAVMASVVPSLAASIGSVGLARRGEVPGWRRYSAEGVDRRQTSPIIGENGTSPVTGQNGIEPIDPDCCTVNEGEAGPGTPGLVPFPQ
ncbi:hypothetical protein EIP91_008167 [Steccherinum ochraceum]|uniref:Uncharacterized protein n=1 Tax=Steccherinum ochraceum TaxID=92696 RepID=A0A4R0R380_9APHY|nr:hypothetical protein EIP91_008167 [Steccherinum ochraceum]